MQLLTVYKGEKKIASYKNILVFTIGSCCVRLLIRHNVPVCVYKGVFLALSRRRTSIVGVLEAPMVAAPCCHFWLKELARCFVIVMSGTEKNFGIDKVSIELRGFG